MKKHLLLPILLLGCLLFTTAAFAQSSVIISEFMAFNTKTLKDEDGEYSDWIEIQNTGRTTVELLNWSLTDKSDNLTQWQFPATNIAPGQFIVVFASSKNRRVPGAPLHTNFRLSGTGEYLALVAPDGTNIVSQFEARGQAADVSYGIGLATTNLTVINTNDSPVRVRIPANGNDGTNWTIVGYNDSSWIAGTNGVGFGSTNVIQADYSAAVLPTQPVGYWRLNESSGTSAANLGTGAGLNGTYTSVTLGTDGPRPPQFGGFEADNKAPTFSAGYVASAGGLLSGRNAFTIGGWIKPAATPGSRIGLFGQNDCVEFGFISGTGMQCWTPGGGSLDYPYPLPMNTWQHVVAVGDGTNIRIYTNGVLAATGGTPTSSYGSSAYTFNIGGGGIYDTTGNSFNGQIDEVVVYHRALSTNEIRQLFLAGINAVGGSVVPFVKTDVGPVMSNINASAYVRLPFTVSDPTNVALLSLRLRYNDGVAAFLNGVEMARVNAPETLSYDSAATNTHSASVVEEFRFGGLEVLVPGANMLAIQGLNRAVTNQDFLVQAELVLSSVAAASTMPVYFTVPTPGGPNQAGVPILGPSILDVNHTPSVPLDSEDVTVTARVVQTFETMSNVVLRYRIMFNNEIETPMLDDGLHGDGLAGDGVYGASIPASASTNGQMIRWFIRATDVKTNVSRWPLFTDPAGSAEYLGTIVNPTNVVSKIPIMHWFWPASQQAAIDTKAGGRASVFFDGEFYDNVFLRLRGNSTASYLKKSRRAEFNREHPLRHPGPGPRLRDTSWVADWPDPTYMRQGLSYWLCEQMGSPAPFYYPMRWQLNGDFYMLANHNDVHGEELLSRLGYDPNGALYNAAGTVQTNKQSTGGFDKKTRQWETPDGDYFKLAYAIHETNQMSRRFTNVMDMFDVPNAINYLVTARWIHENDDVWANLSLYHDNDGDDLWRIVPFDVNLSWGAIFAEGDAANYNGVQSTNDNHKAHPLYGTTNTPALSGPGAPNNYNRVYDAFLLNPVTREMFLRRLRTLMDTYIRPMGTAPYSTDLEKKIIAWRDLIAEEANRDRAKWGWPAKGGQCNFDPGIDITNGVKGLVEEFIWRRRQHFYVKHSIGNTNLAIGVTKDRNAGIPFAQRLDLNVAIAGIEYNPASGNQAHEYICITNPNPVAIDLSDWKLGGGVDFTFAKGTVLGSNRVLYVSPDLKAFKARTTGPRGGQALLVVGPYKGQLSARGESLTIHDNYDRLVTTNGYVGAPSLAQQFLRITEMMFHPADPASGSYVADDFEYIELKNTSPTVTLDLTGIRFVNGIDFTFTGGTLAPGQRVLVVANLAAFTSRYGTGLNVAGQYMGLLDNSGERIQLVDAVGEEILDFSYSDGWYPTTDGLGSSLVVVDESAQPDLWGSKSNWRASTGINGTPGAGEPAPTLFVPVLINEVLSRTDVPPPTDSIELYNPTSTNADIGGWYLTDDLNTPKKFRIPNGTTIAGGGYRVFTEADFNPTPGTPPSFALGSDGDEVYLFSATLAGDLTGYVHGFSFGAADNGVSFGRYLTSEGKERFLSQQSLTLDATNSGPRVGPVVVSEIHYHPVDFAGGSDNDLDEFVELRNIVATNVALFDPAHPTNVWRLRDAVSYRFPTNTTLSSGETVLVVGFDPADAAALAAFRAKFGVPAGVAVFGPWSGKLDNSAGNVELVKPSLPLLSGDIPEIMVDKVDYTDAAPWPEMADGNGPSLQRLILAAYGNDPVNWTAAAPNAGTDSSGGLAPSILVHPASMPGVLGQTAVFSVVASGAGPLRYQWMFDGVSIAGATNASLSVENPGLTSVGNYSVTVFNPAGSVLSSNAFLSIVLPIVPVAQPADVLVRVRPEPTAAPTTNAVFSASAFSENPPVRFQWLRDGAPLSGQTNATLTVVNVTTNDLAAFACVVSDSVSSIQTSNAMLYPLILPQFVTFTNVTFTTNGATITTNRTAITPTLTAATNSMVTYGVKLAAGFPPPFTYEWRRGSVGIAPGSTNTTTATSSYYTFQTMPTAVSTGYRVVVKNMANSNPGVQFQFSVVTQLDLDGDGLPDGWETAYGLSANNTADALGDLDGDTMANWQEYVAGTDPTNALSYLKVNALTLTNGSRLEFMAMSNRTYTVEFNDTLENGSWSRLADLSAYGTNRLETVADPAGGTNRFYRLVTPARP